MRTGRGEQVHSEGGIRMGSRPSIMAGDDRADYVLRGVGIDEQGGATVRHDIRGNAGHRSRSEGARHATPATGPAHSARRSARQRRCRNAIVKLAMYYLLVSAAFACLSAVSPGIADGAVVAFIAMLLVPAMYAEFLRVRRR